MTHKTQYWNPSAFDPFASIAVTLFAAGYLSRSLIGVALDNVRAWLTPLRRPRAIALFMLPIGVIGGVLCLAGCCVPCRGSCGPCGQMPPNYCLPNPPNYGEPMHPVFRQDGRQVLVPHTQFRGWVTSDTPSPTTPSGP